MKLPASIFESCPRQLVEVGDMALTISAAKDIDSLLDFYAETRASDADAIPYFAVLWDSALAMAGHLGRKREQIAGKRVIELGCGLGLPSLVAARCGADVLATDFHPYCEAFLRRNAEQNGLRLEFALMDWECPPEGIGGFDIVLASDVVYDKTAVPHLVAAAGRVCAEGGVIYLADPGRGNLQDAMDAFVERGFEWEMFAVGEMFVFELCREAGVVLQ